MNEQTAHRVELPNGLPAELIDEIRSRMGHLSEDLEHCEIDRTGVASVVFVLRRDSKTPAAELSHRIRALTEELMLGYQAIPTKVVLDRMDRPVPHGSDPHEELIARDQLRFFGPGRAGFGPWLVELMEFFDDTIRNVAKECGAISHRFPTIIAADVLKRGEYLAAFPQTVTLVAHLRQDLEVLRHFTRPAAEGHEPFACDLADAAPVTCMLAPTVCFHYYAWLEGRTVRDTAITCAGRIARYEAGAFVGLERLWEYSGREIVFVGAPDYVVDCRSNAMRRFAEIFDGLELAYSIQSSSDPFFVDVYSRQRAIQVMCDLKFEMRMRLPYRDGDIAVGSFNYHRGHFGDSMQIRLAEGGAPAHTACVGFGLERLALALLAQYGVDRRRWPSALRAALG